MRINALSYICWLALSSTASAIGLQAATHKSHLLVAPSFGSDDIELHPALHPDHDPNDLVHLIPTISDGLHWSQEGHRPALHGAKHAHMNSSFKYPTVVLEHSNQVESVECNDDLMIVCFSSPKAMSTVEQSWTAGDMHTLNIITYHSGCGDESGRKRSFFKASYPIFNMLSSCVTMPVTLVGERDMIESGDLTWGTYVSPGEKRREAVKGHVRVTGPVSEPLGETVDLTRNATALKDFFEFETIYPNGTEINSTSAGIDINGTDYTVDGLDFIPYNGKVPYNGTSKRRDLIESSLDKRNIFSWIEKGVTWFVNKLVGIFQTVADVIKSTAEIIQKLALLAADLIAVVFGARFERTYHNDITVDYFRGGQASNKPPKIGDIGKGFELAKSGALFTIECTRCGIEAEMTVDGELAFSIKEGITKGEVVLINKKDFNLHAIFGIKLEGKIPKDVTRISKQIGALPLSPLAIPGIFTLGPQVSVSVAASLALEGEINLLIGGTATIGPGTARLSLVNQNRNKLEGFKPSFQPVAEVTSGSITATADLGLPIALEVGIDVLNGAFKQTVGLVDTPSVYFTAQYSKGQDKKCDNGVELRFGVKNRLYLTAFNVYDYTLDETKIYETGLTCITTTGFNKEAVEPDENVFKTVATSFGGEQNLATNSTPKLNNVAAGLTTTVKGNEGFRIIMDEKETSILVSGTDGYVYLSEKKQDYDLSAPWGSLDIKQDVLDFDVFGRLLCYNIFDYLYGFGAAMPLQLCAPKTIPKHFKVAALSVLKNGAKSFHSYGASIPVFLRGNKPMLFYTTACKMKGHGLRVFLTEYLVKAGGRTVDINGKSDKDQITARALKKRGVKNIKDCRTVMLTSKLIGSDKKQNKL